MIINPDTQEPFTFGGTALDKAGPAWLSLPQPIALELARYFASGSIHIGHFTLCVLADRLSRAASCADHTNRNYLYAIGVFIHRFAPVASYGSYSNVYSWQASGGIFGMMAAREGRTAATTSGEPGI